MNPRSKTQGLDLEDTEEFPSLPQQSVHPLTVLPQLPSTIPVTEFTVPQETMDEVSMVMASSQNPILQPNTSLSSGPISGLVVTSNGDVETPDPSMLERGNMPANLFVDGLVGIRNRGSHARSVCSRSSRYSHSSRRGRSDGAGNSVDTIIQVRSEQARAQAEAKVKAKAAWERQQYLKEFQEKQLAIKKKEALARAEKEVLTLENEQLQTQSESWLRDQREIQESLAVQAGAEAEADAIIQETNSRSASPNIGLDNMTTNEKISRFLGVSDSDNSTTEPYANSVVFHPNTLNSVCPEQTLVITQPVVTTTTTPANNVYVPPHLRSVNVHPTPILSDPVVSHIPASTFHNTFVPLSLHRSPLTQVKSIGNPNQKSTLADPIRKVTGPGAIPRIRNPNRTTANQPTFPQAPPTITPTPKGGMHHSYSPPRAVPMNQGNPYSVSPPQNANPTSPARSSGSSHSSGSNGSRKSRREDKLSAILGALTLRNIEIGEAERFSGEISRYHEFRVRYNGLMKNVADAQTKLDYLFKWTKGEAHRAIAKCVYNENHESALDDALKTLEERFGTPFKIADRKVEDIVSGKEVKRYDEKALWYLIDELELCNAATKASKGTAEDLWSINNLRRIIGKRCPSLQDSWTKRACKIESAGRKANFDPLLGFLKEQAREWGSTFARNAFSDQDQRKPKPERSYKPDFKGKYDKPLPKSSLGTEGNPPMPNPSSQAKTGTSICDCCKKGNHMLVQCPIFRSKAPMERYTHIIASKRCINCFSNMHWVKDCPSLKRCQTCQKPHHNMLHRESQNQPQGSVPSRTKSLENAAMCFSSTARKSREITNTRPVVAVNCECPKYQSLGGHVIKQLSLT